MRASAALYKIAAAKKRRPVTAGAIHTARIVVNGTRFEHWLDGEKAAEGDLASQALRAAMEANRADGEKKFRAGGPPSQARYSAALEMVQTERLLLLDVPESPIDFTHHYSRVWFRNIKIRRLP